MRDNLCYRKLEDITQAKYIEDDYRITKIKVMIDMKYNAAI